jgi:hypothetical protein
MPAAIGNDVEPHALVEQYRLMTVAEIMEARLGKAEFAAPVKLGGSLSRGPPMRAVLPSPDNATALPWLDP